MSSERIITYDHIASKIAAMSDEDLTSLLYIGQPFHEGIGGTSRIVTFEGIHVFVKQVPLTDVEGLAENLYSTANLNSLPTFYQYGVGSTGFGVWRELKAHKITTDWVLKNQCPNFPILYHWRVIETDRPQTISPNVRAQIEKDVVYWEGSDVVRKRLEAISACSAHLYLFLECIPQERHDWQNLYDWLQIQVKAGGLGAAEAILMVESTLLHTATFMKEHGVIHMDMHFWNILTDGKTLYVSDFGLASSSSFELSAEEKQFYDSHIDYDSYSISVNLLHCIITALYGQEDWIEKLKTCMAGDQEGLDSTIREVILRHGDIAIKMDSFYMDLQKVSKQTKFPFLSSYI
jgi:hypothetical protein